MITQEQRTARQQYAGSSDAPAICGVDQYQSAWDVWAEKTGRAAPWEGNEATDAGTALERVVLDWAVSRVGGKFARDIMKVSGLIAANFDGLGESFTVEAKTTGITGPPDPAFGSEVLEGSMEDVSLPDRVKIQCVHQFAVAGPQVRVAWVPVLIGGAGFRMYRLDRDDALVDVVAEKCIHFMTHHVKLGIEPSDSKPSIEVLRRIRRQPNKVISIGKSLIDDLVVFRSAAKKASDDKEAAEARVVMALGDAEAGEDGTGRTLTFFEQKRKAYEVKEASFRVLRVRTPKE